MITSSHPQPSRDAGLNLGTGPASTESRSGSFAHGALGSEGLLLDQLRYQDLVPRSYRQAGVAQLQENQRSALSLGLSASDPRTGTFAGQRWLMSSSNGRSQTTTQAAPRFADQGENL